MTDRSGAQLAVATVAFTVCFYAWACSARSAPTCRTPSGCPTSRPRSMVAVPVLLGSLMRIPLGVAHRPPRRPHASSPR